METATSDKTQTLLMAKLNLKTVDLIIWFGENIWLLCVTYLYNIMQYLVNES